MVRRPKTAVERQHDPVDIMRNTMRFRKDLQENNMFLFERAKDELKDEIKEIEGQTLKKK